MSLPVQSLKASLRGKLTCWQNPTFSRAHIAALPSTRRSKATAMSAAQGNGTTPSQPTQQQPQQQQQQQDPVQFMADGTLTCRTKLSIVVTDATRRWFLEAEKEAYRGDVKAQALLGNMLIEGYGCKADPEVGRQWVEKARRRGYRMQGVYCEI